MEKKENLAFVPRVTLPLMRMAGIICFSSGSQILWQAMKEEPRLGKLVLSTITTYLGVHAAAGTVGKMLLAEPRHS